MQSGFLISDESRLTLDNRRLRMKSTETGSLRTEKEMGDVLRTEGATSPPSSRSKAHSSSYVPTSSKIHKYV